MPETMIGLVTDNSHGDWFSIIPGFHFNSEELSWNIQLICHMCKMEVLTMYSYDMLS